ncbi:MAG: hypothetical protein J6Y53_01300 [Alphaproteobacteria bacterium]|nr:hypothetical protein [Alphaproteobacteria bacterium]
MLDTDLYSMATKTINGEELSMKDKITFTKMMISNKDKLLDELDNKGDSSWEITTYLSFLAEQPSFKENILDLFEKTATNLIEKDKEDKTTAFDNFAQRAIMNGVRRMVRTGVEVTHPIKAEDRAPSENDNIHLDGHTVKDDEFSLPRLKRGLNLALKISGYKRNNAPVDSISVSEIFSLDTKNFMHDMLLTNDHLYTTGKISHDDANWIDRTLKQISDNIDLAISMNKYAGNPLKAYDSVKDELYPSTNDNHGEYLNSEKNLSQKIICTSKIAKTKFLT